MICDFENSKCVYIKRMKTVPYRTDLTVLKLEDLPHNSIIF
jgi:hypothetical protein